MRIIKQGCREWWEELIMKLKSEIIFLGLNILATLLAFAFDPLSLRCNYPNLNEAIYFTIYLLVSTIIVIFIFGLSFYIIRAYIRGIGKYASIDFPLKVIPCSPLAKEENEPRWATIKVENTSPDTNIESCFLRLDEVIDLSINEKIWEIGSNLTWGFREQIQHKGEFGNETKTIVAGNYRDCDIATTHPGNTEMHFTFWVGRFSLKEGEYRVKIRVFGRWDDKPVFRDEEFILRYDGGNTLEIVGI